MTALIKAFIIFITGFIWGQLYKYTFSSTTTRQSYYTQRNYRGKFDWWTFKKLPKTTPIYL